MTRSKPRFQGAQLRESIRGFGCALETHIADNSIAAAATSISFTLSDDTQASSVPALDNESRRSKVTAAQTEDKRGATSPKHTGSRQILHLIEHRIVRLKAVQNGMAPQCIPWVGVDPLRTSHSCRHGIAPPMRSAMRNLYLSEQFTGPGIP